LVAAHAAYVTIFMGLGALSVTVLPATCITSEKETRTWPLLLTTAVSDWEILFGKFIGVLRRSLPVWIILLVYLIPYWGIVAVDVLHLACLVVATTVFLCGTGLYASSRLRRTSAAVAANFVIAGLVWGILPALVTLFSYAFRPVYRRSLIELCWQTIPFVQAMQATWPDSGHGSPNSGVYLVGYILLGILFAWRAKCRFRRDIFHHVVRALT
jgi:ABC-type transport system involved in multi-copper enzyme maturation permease subunit